MEIVKIRYEEADVDFEMNLTKNHEHQTASGGGIVGSLSKRR